MGSLIFPQKKEIRSHIEVTVVTSCRSESSNSWQILNMPLYRNFTTTYSTTEKAGFWSNYMTGLKGPLCAQDPPPKVEQVPLWDRVTSADVTLYDVLFGAEETPE